LKERERSRTWENGTGPKTKKEPRREKVRERKGILNKWEKSEIHHRFRVQARINH